MTEAHILLWLRDMLVATGGLILLVLLLRRPVARWFGANAAYWLWALPVARLVMPAIEGAPVSSAAESIAFADAGAAGGSLPPAALGAAPAPGLIEQAAALLPSGSMLAALWAAGAIALLTGALWADRQYRRRLLSGATPLDPIGSIRLVMSEAADGPVAFGLLRRHIAVPRDFFLRYDAAERALALDHELAHHKGGDLWANAAALLVLAVQWFNPLAWSAWRAFRFDQEAACDARVIASAGTPATHTYAHAVAKTAVGRSLSLAAPMASHHDLKERIRMMIDNPETPRRKLAGKLLLGGALVASLAMTATVLPAAAFATDGDEPEVKTEVKREHHVVLVTADSDGKVTVDGDAADGEKRIQRIIINKAGEDGPGPNVMVFGGDGTEIADGEKRIIRLQAPMMGLSAAEIEKTLVEQGVDAAKAKDIAAKLEAQRAEKMHSAMGAIHGAQGGAIHSMHFSSKDGMMVDMAGCKDGTNGKVLVDRSGEADGAKTKVRMVRCTDGPVDKAKEIAAMKKARERLASDLGKEGSMSREIRESVIADMDKAIAELEAGK